MPRKPVLQQHEIDTLLDMAALKTPASVIAKHLKISTSLVYSLAKRGGYPINSVRAARAVKHREKPPVVMRQEHKEFLTLRNATAHQIGNTKLGAPIYAFTGGVAEPSYTVHNPVKVEIGKDAKGKPIFGYVHGDAAKKLGLDDADLVQE